ncbi:hypothetical protein B0T18DRAFT_131535 [Schizothecium vesticola]|uniref:Uncharacterized protein n=1 Tax=Schizothecium vesticola TaxID=314040 RepID=A0AA40K9A0_9PEZI|nr:hypothetical protein B0T18DRAFT_131535 [Schizothecium vesticola]
MTGALDDDSWTNATLGTPQSMASYGRAVKINKTCEQCRLKKVRCIESERNMQLRRFPFQACPYTARAFIIYE